MSLDQASLPQERSDNLAHGLPPVEQSAVINSETELESKLETESTQNSRTDHPKASDDATGDEDNASVEVSSIQLTSGAETSGVVDCGLVEGKESQVNGAKQTAALVEPNVEDAVSQRENSESDTGAVKEKDTLDKEWDSLSHTPEETRHESGQEELHGPPAVVEEGEVVDSRGLPQVEDNHDMQKSETPVNVILFEDSLSRPDLKPSLPSPKPWETDDPLTSLAQPKSGYRTSGSPTPNRHIKHSRPLKPKSSYYFGPPPSDSAFGTPPIGHIGVHYPREMVRIERDYSGGELPQFAAIYPLEFEGRLSPTQFLESINAINEILISAYSLRHACFDSALAIFSLQLTRLFLRTHYEKEMERLQATIKELNETLFNPVGLNILCPRNVAFLFLEIEYY